MGGAAVMLVQVVGVFPDSEGEDGKGCSINWDIVHSNRRIILTLLKP